MESFNISHSQHRKSCTLWNRRQQITLWNRRQQMTPLNLQNKTVTHVPGYHINTGTDAGENKWAARLPQRQQLFQQAELHSPTFTLPAPQASLPIPITLPLSPPWHQLAPGPSLLDVSWLGEAITVHLGGHFWWQPVQFWLSRWCSQWKGYLPRHPQPSLKHDRPFKFTAQFPYIH